MSDEKKFVYVVLVRTDDAYEDPYVVGAFEEESDAQKLKRLYGKCLYEMNYNGMWVGKVEVNPKFPHFDEDLAFYRVSYDYIRGRITQLCTSLDFENDLAPQLRGGDGYKVIDFSCWARDEEHAAEIAKKLAAELGLERESK